MNESPRIEGLLRRIRRELRRRRAESYGLRGAFWGAVAGVVVLLAKHAVGGAAAWVAAALVILGAVAGIAHCASPRAAPGDAARVARPAVTRDPLASTPPASAAPAGLKRRRGAHVTRTLAHRPTLQL